MRIFYRYWQSISRPCPFFFSRSLCALVAIAGLAVPAQATNVDPAAHAVEMQRRQDQDIDQLRSRYTQHPDVLSKPDASNVDINIDGLPVETMCFTLDNVQWGDEQPPRALRELALAIIGKCVGIQGLQALQSQMTASLIEGGLITGRVVVPEQSLVQGTLTLHYLPGRISAVNSASTPGWWRMAMPSGVGAELSQRDLDQALENIRRLKGQSDAHIDIVPGAEAGSSDVLLQPGTGKRWHAYVGADNAGMTSMGREQLNAGLTLDSPLFLYDQFSVAWNSNASLRRSRNYTYARSLNYSIPFGYWSAFVGAADSRYQQVLSGFAEPILYGGTTKQVEVGISAVPYRGAHYKGSAVFKVLRKRVSSTLNNIDIDVQRRDVTGYELGHQHRHYFSRVVLDIGAGIRGTFPKYSNQPGYVYGEPDWNGRSTSFIANAGVYAPFSIARLPLSYQLNWHIQHAKTSLVPSEYFTIGDRYSVRGFDGRMTLASEDGWTLRNDFSLNVGNTGQQLYVGLDAGRVSGKSSQYLSGRTLIGAVTGLRGRVSLPYIDASYDLSLGRPLKKPESFSVSSTVFTAALSVEF